MPFDDGELLRVLLLRDHNTRMVVLTTALLGLVAGLVGAFLLLRRRALISDALSHATLPGIGGAFLVMLLLGGTGKWLPGLLVGAAVTGLAGVLLVSLIVRTTRLKDDAAMGVVLSVGFGLGLVLLDVAQRMPGGAAAGLKSFIYGKTASIVHRDLLLVAGVAAVALLATLALVKELTLLCFDEGFARAQGWPVARLDALLLGLLTLVTVIGLQAVGLILVVALFIVPPAAARFWTDRLRPLLATSAGIGAASGWIGAATSGLAPDLPAGALIVLAATACFGLSLLLGPARGLLARRRREGRLRRSVGRQHLLRALYELEESRAAPDAIRVADVLAHRTWGPRRVRRLLGRCRRAGLVRETPGGGLALTEAGRLEAARHARNHRLWEHYLVTHADVAPSHVDRGADQIEHVLGPELVARLEATLAASAPTEGGGVPPSPHVLRADGEGGP